MGPQLELCEAFLSAHSLCLHPVPIPGTARLFMSEIRPPRHREGKCLPEVIEGMCSTAQPLSTSIPATR